MRSTIGMKVLLTGILAIAMLVSGAAAKDDEIENMLPNPDFESATSGWSISGGFGILTISKEEDPIGGVGSAVFAEVINVGAENWEPEIHSPPFPLENGKQYTYSFWAKAEPDSVRTLGPRFEQLDTWVGIGQDITVTDEWQEFHFTGVWTDPSSPPQVVIHIGFNKQLDDVWFSHFRVYEGDYEQEDIEGQQKISVTPMDRLATAWGQIKSR